MTVLSEFSGDSSRNKTMFRANFIPDFVPFFVFPILLRLSGNII